MHCVCQETPYQVASSGAGRLRESPAGARIRVLRRGLLPRDDVGARPPAEAAALRHPARRGHHHLPTPGGLLVLHALPGTGSGRVAAQSREVMTAAILSVYISLVDI